MSMQCALTTISVAIMLYIICNSTSYLFSILYDTKTMMTVLNKKPILTSHLLFLGGRGGAETACKACNNLYVCKW